MAVSADSLNGPKYYRDVHDKYQAYSAFLPADGVDVLLPQFYHGYLQKSATFVVALTYKDDQKLCPVLWLRL
jgi:hypothetical protein